MRSAQSTTPKSGSTLSSSVWFTKPRAATLAYGYDLALHAVLIGFVLSMAMGHAVIVIPAITGAAAPYHRAMYLGFAALHASVALRVAGDLMTWDNGRMLSGPLTILGLLAYIAVIARQIRQAARRSQRLRGSRLFG